MGRPKSDKPHPWEERGVSKSKYYRDMKERLHVPGLDAVGRSEPAKRAKLGRPKKIIKRLEESALAAIKGANTSYWQHVSPDEKEAYEQAVRDRALAQEFMERSAMAGQLVLTDAMAAALRRELAHVIG